LRRGASYLSTARARDRHRGEAIKFRVYTRRARARARPHISAGAARASTRDGVERARAVGGRGERDDADDGGRDVDDV
jgi:hypothetical protein